MAVIERSIKASWQMRVFFVEDVFKPDNPALVEALADNGPHRVLVVLEDSLAQSLPRLESQIENYFSANAAELKLVRPPLFVPGGEPAKNSITLVTDLLGHFYRHHIDRNSYVIAVGGGALLDVTGFAAATCHRGVRLVRIPTTTLSQADSGVGVKNSINAFGQKNFVGTFAPPFAVFNDFNLLRTLDPRDKRSGYAEAVKVACLFSPDFFAEIERDAAKLTAFEPEAMKRLIARSAELNLNLTADSNPFEPGSARSLYFGHWGAHKLEQLSRFRIRHGEAVAIGIALDVVYSRLSGLLDEPSTERILNLFQRLGFRLYADEMLNADNGNHLLLLSGLDEFREHLGGDLTITLLKAIGESVEVHEMNPDRIVAAINCLRSQP
jgi:3-dehydroquinate synthase